MMTEGEPVSGAWIKKRDAAGMLMSRLIARMTSTVLSGSSSIESTGAGVDAAEVDLCAGR